MDTTSPPGGRNSSGVSSQQEEWTVEVTWGSNEARIAAAFCEEDVATSEGWLCLQTATRQIFVGNRRTWISLLQFSLLDSRTFGHDFVGSVWGGDSQWQGFSSDHAADLTGEPRRPCDAVGTALPWACKRPGGCSNRGDFQSLSSCSGLGSHNPPPTKLRKLRVSRVQWDFCRGQGVYFGCTVWVRLFTCFVRWWLLKKQCNLANMERYRTVLSAFRDLESWWFDHFWVFDQFMTRHTLEALNMRQKKSGRDTAGTDPVCSSGCVAWSQHITAIIHHQNIETMMQSKHLKRTKKKENMNHHEPLSNWRLNSLIGPSMYWQFQETMAECVDQAVQTEERFETLEVRWINVLHLRSEARFWQTLIKRLEHVETEFFRSRYARSTFCVQLKIFTLSMHRDVSMRCLCFVVAFSYLFWSTWHYQATVSGPAIVASKTEGQLKAWWTS